MNWKKIKCFIAAILGILLLMGCTDKHVEENPKDLLAEIQERGEIVIATEGTWAPWTYHNEQDELVGFDVEVAEKIAAKLGVKPVFVETKWDSIFAGMDVKRYDLVANGVEITEERSEKYDFSTPYAYIRTALIVRADNADINSFEDLEGKKTANTLASTYASIAESYGAKTLGVDDLNQTIELMLANRVDATLNAEVTYYDYQRVHPDSKLRIAALTDEASKVSFPLRSGQETERLRVAIDSAIAELQEEGVLSEISIKYFGSDITTPLKEEAINLTEEGESESIMNQNEIYVEAGGRIMIATLVENSSVEALKELLADGR